MSTKPKLIKATIKTEVLFVSDGKPDKEAPHYLQKEVDEGGGLIPPDSQVEIEEVSSMEQVPSSWKNAIVWNCEALNLCEAKPGHILEEIYRSGN